MFKRLALAIAGLALLGCSDATRPEVGVVRSDTTQTPDTTRPDTTGIAQRRLIECPTTKRRLA